ncbi:MAG TPA: shikimate kinase [Opitutaceae bacterium]|nr:shikimate kinase [Opitutaceae bacterium]
MLAGDVNLYLVGFMGTGKSTVGRAAAQRLSFDFVDSDHEIERKAGKTIAEIFAQEGEPAFRAAEREFVTGGHAPQRLVVACGGGLIVQPGLAGLLAERGVVVCLHASVETILARTARQTDRPLLNVDDREARIRSLLAEREPLYRRTGTLVMTDARPLKDIVAHVARIWHREAGEFVKRRG